MLALNRAAWATSVGSDVHGKLGKQAFKDIQISLSPPYVRVSRLLKQGLGSGDLPCLTIQSATLSNPMTHLHVLLPATT